MAVLSRECNQRLVYGGIGIAVKKTSLLVSVVVCGFPIFRIWFYAKKGTVF